MVVERRGSESESESDNERALCGAAKGYTEFPRCCDYCCCAYKYSAALHLRQSDGENE
jgi:hypothetical protein